MKPIIQKVGLMLVMLLTNLISYAYDFEVDGIYYNILSVTELTCTVAKGDYKGAVAIPEEVVYNNRKLKVVEIDDKAFMNCTALEAISIPNSVTAIGNSTFDGCTSLESISLPNSVTYISYRAFANCTTLALISIPNSVTSIDSYAFYGCSALESINIPNSVTSIGSYAFYGCSALESINIPNSVTSIGSYAFYCCSALASINIPNSVTAIGDDAFNGCTALESIFIPNSVTSIGYSVFEDCSALVFISIPNSVTSIGCNAFNRCTSLESISIPNSVTFIGSYAFKGCTSLKNIKLSNSLKKINYGLFHNCKALEALEIPGSVNTLSQNLDSFDFYTFGGCDSLKKISFLKSTAKLAVGSEQHNDFYETGWSSWTKNIEELYINRPFIEPIPVQNLKKLELGDYINDVDIQNISSLTKLDTIVCYNLTPPSLGSMTNLQYANIVVYVPDEALELYQSSDGWKNFWNLKPLSEYVSDDETTSIKNINTYVDEDDVEVFLINGIKVGNDIKNLAPGLYIVKRGTSVEKLLVR